MVVGTRKVGNLELQMRQAPGLNTSATEQGAWNEHCRWLSEANLAEDLVAAHLNRGASMDQNSEQVTVDVEGMAESTVSMVAICKNREQD